MLHRISPAAVAQLRNIMVFQRKVLAFACRPTLTLPLNREEVETAFGLQAAWLWSHTSLHGPITRLNAAIRARPDLSCDLLAAFDNDVAFDAHVDDSTFAFAGCKLRADVRVPVGDLLVLFYELLGRNRGFSGEITGGDPLTRDDVVQGFWCLNSELRVCPACDGPRPDRTNGKVHAQCDHHFPKSAHAALSVHPGNVIPLCLDCNLTFKGERDASEKAQLSEMFLPYQREAFGPLEVRVLREAAGDLAVQITDGGTADTSRVEALNYILQLRERWGDRLGTRVSPHVFAALRQQHRTAARRGDPAADRLTNIVAQREGFHVDRGKRHDAILAEAYCALLEADATERDGVFAEM